MVVRSWSRAVLAPLGALLLAGCPQASEPPKPAGNPPAKKLVDACVDSPPPWRKYDGPLRDVRCEQEMFLTMAGIADDLGVKCGHCHQTKPDGKSFDYPPMTKNKETALWMDQTFMRSLKRADGQPMTCASCHVDKHGKPAAKFLGTPRDIPWTVEWMTTVMTNRFVLENGEKLKCKHCHGAAWGQKGFLKEVIGKTEQVPHLKLTPAEPAPSAPPPASASAAPSAATPAPSASSPKPP